MVTSSVAANVYRWAYPAIERMTRHRPAIVLDLFRADPATKHYVALIIRGWEVRQGRSEEALERLAADIFSRPRAVLLAEIWGVSFGKLRFLKRLPGCVLQRARYDLLVSVLRDPQRRSLLGHLPKISPGEIEAIALFEEPLLAAASTRAVAAIGRDLLDYVIAVSKRRRPDLDEAAFAARLQSLAGGKDLSDWLRELLRLADLPPPPWQGSETIVPLRTVAAIDAAGLEFQNCLRAEDWWLSAIVGQRFLYRVGGRDGLAIVSVTLDPLLGAWRVETCTGPFNLPLKRAAERRILDAFAAAGIGYFGDYPMARALNWSDDLLTEI